VHRVRALEHKVRVLETELKRIRYVLLFIRVRNSDAIVKYCFKHAQ